MVAVEGEGEDRASCSPRASTSDEEEAKDGHILAEKVLEQAIELKAQKLRIDQLLREQKNRSLDRPRNGTADRGAAMAKLQERLYKAEKRASDFSKRYNTANQALKSKDKELKTLRTKASQLEKANEKTAKTCQMLQNYVGRLESRLQASLNTKDDTERMKELSASLSVLLDDNESLQRDLKKQIEENILLSESLNEVRKLIDNEALSLGLESGEILVELTNQKQMCSTLEEQVEAQKKDNQLLLDYIKDIRLSSQLDDASVLKSKLANPVLSERMPAAAAAAETTTEDLANQRRLEMIREEIEGLSLTVKAQEERERLLIQTSQEERAELAAVRRELSETQSRADTLTFQNETFKKKAAHLKGIFKSLNAFCSQVSKMNTLSDLGSLDSSDALDEIERTIVNMSTNILGPENRAFLKVYLSILAVALGQRRECIQRVEEMGILKETVKEMSFKVSRLSKEKAVAEKELSRQQALRSHTKTVSDNAPSFSPQSSRSTPVLFEFKTKSFADSIQDDQGSAPGPKSVRSDQTSRKLGDLERELQVVKSIAKRSHEKTRAWQESGGVGEGEDKAMNGERHQDQDQDQDQEGVGSTTKMVMAGRLQSPEPHESPDTDFFLSPMSRLVDSAEASPAVDFTAHQVTHFTPGKYTIKERLELLEARFSKLNQKQNTEEGGETA